MKSTTRAIQAAAFLLLAAVSLIGIASCGGAYTPPSVANTVDMDAAHWSLLYGAGTPSHPATAQPGWQFDIPAAPGSVHYVVAPFNATEDLTGMTLTITFRVVSSQPAYSANVEAGESGPPSFHMFLERSNDDFTNQYYRWWCSAGGYLLGTQDNQTITLSCPLNYTSWSSVYNQSDQAHFTDTLKNLGGVGVTFGGTGGWGHGVNLLSGSAQFQLLDASISSAAPTVASASRTQAGN